MPAIRRYMDPDTGDYEVENGGPKNDSSQSSAIILRLRLRRGSCPVAPNLGSRIHTVKSSSAAGLRLIEAFAVECVRDLVGRGVIRGVVAETKKYTGGLVRLILSYKDANGVLQMPIEISVAVGAG